MHFHRPTNIGLVARRTDLSLLLCRQFRSPARSALRGGDHSGFRLHQQVLQGQRQGSSTIQQHHAEGKALLQANSRLHDDLCSEAYVPGLHCLHCRFGVLQEPTRQELLAYAAGGPRPVRTAHVIATESSNRTPIEMDVDLDSAQVLGMEVRLQELFPHLLAAAALAQAQ